MKDYSFAVFADYHQFYLWDAGCSPSAPDDFSDADIENRVKAAPNVVVIQPVRAMDVSVRLILADSAPPLALEHYDHVVECSLELPTGSLQVHECTGGPVFDDKIAPGTYRVRALFENLGSISEDGLEGDDRYTLVLWPAPSSPLRVVKQWSSPV